MSGKIPVGGMETDITLDGSQPVRTLKELRQAVTNSTTALKAQVAQLKASGQSAEIAKAKYDGLKNSIDKQKEYIAGLTREQKHLVEAQKNVDRSTKDGKIEFGKYSEQIAKNEGQIQRAETRLASLNSQQNKAKSSVEYYRSGLASLQKEYKSTTEVTKNYVARLKAEHNEFQASKVQMRSYKSSLTNLTEQLTKQKIELKRVADETGKNSEAYRKQENRVNKTGKSLAELKNNQKAVRAEFNRFHPTGIDVADKAITKLRQSTSKLSSALKSSLAKVKTAAVGATAVVASLGVFALNGAKEAGSLQKVYTENTNLLVTSGEKIKDVTKEVTGMQKDGRKYSIQYAESQQNIASGYQELIKRGYSGKQSLGAMNSILQASKASGDSFADTMQVTTSTLEAFGMRTKSTAGMLKNTKIVANKLAMAADATATDFKSLGIGMNYVGTSAKTAGITLTQTASAMGVLSNSGLEAQQAGTGLRKILISLQTPSKSGENALHKYGMSIDDFKTKAGKLKPIANIFQEIADHVPKADRSNFFHNVFGTTGQNAAAILATNTKELRAVNKQVANAYKNNYVGKLAQKNMKATKNQEKQFHEAVDAIRIDIGSAMMPALSKASTALVKAFNKPETVRGLKEIAGGIGKVANKVADFIAWIVKGDNLNKITKIGKVLLGTFASYKLLKGIVSIKRTISDLLVGPWINKSIDSATKTYGLAGTKLGSAFSKGMEKAVNFKNGLFNSGNSAGKLTGLLQSAHSAKGFSNLTTGGKIGTGLAGAGIVADVGANLFNAVKDRHSADKRSQDIGKSIGAGIGGGIGLWFGGPAGAAVGSQIGKVVGKWGGDAVNQFTKGWQSKKPPKQKLSLKNLGWSTHDLFNDINKNINSFFKSINSNKYVKAFQKGNFLKVSTKDIHKKWKSFVNTSNKNSKKFYKDFQKNWGNFWKKVNSNRYVKAFQKGKFFQTALKDIKSRWKSFSTDFSKKWGSLWKKVNSNRYVKAFQKGKFFQTALSDIKSRWKTFSTDFGKKWSDFWQGIVKDFKSFGKTIKDDWTGSINNIIGGFNDVIHAFGGSKKTVDYLHFANGTDWRKRYGVPAILNDGNDSPETGNREGVLNPDGTIEVISGRNVKRRLWPWQDVINAHDMATMFGKAYHFASGTKQVIKAKTDNSKLLKLIDAEIKKHDRRYQDAKDHRDKQDRRHDKKDSAAEKKRAEAKARAKAQKKELDKLGDRISKALKSGNTAQAKKLTAEFNNLSKSYSKTKKAAKKPNKHAGQTLVDQGLLTGASRRIGHSQWISNSLFKKLTTASKAKKTTSATRRATTTRRRKSSSSNSSYNLGTSISTVSGKTRASSVNVKSVNQLSKALSKLKSKTIKVTVKVNGLTSVKKLTKAIKKVKGKKPKIKVKVTGTSSLKKLQKSITTTHKRVTSLDKAIKKNDFGKDFAKQAEIANKALNGKGDFAKTFSKMVKDVSKDIKTMKKNATSEFESMEKKIQASMKKIHTGVVKLATSTATGFKNALHKMVGYAGTDMKGTIAQLNRGIKGINKVLSQFGGNSSVIKPVKFARGTVNGALTQDTLAMVNDAEYGPKQEAVIRGNDVLLPQYDNQIVKLQAGDKVLNGYQTLELAHSFGLPHFAKGSGVSHSALHKFAEKSLKNFVQSFKSMFTKNVDTKGNGIEKDFTDLSKRSSTHYGEPWSQAIWTVIGNAIGDGIGKGGTREAFLRYAEKAFTGVKYVMGAASKTASDCSGMVSQALKHFGLDIGRSTIDMQNSKGVQYLGKDVSKTVPGDLVIFGHGTGAAGHVGIVKNPSKGTMFNETPPSARVSRISDDTAMGYGFYRIKGLYDANSKKNKGPSKRLLTLAKKELGSKAIKWIKDKLGDEGALGPNIGGEGVQRWAGTVKRILGMLNLSTSKSMVDKVLRQIQTESGGNPKAKQPGADPDGDGSGPALGLMQTKRATFDAYKRKGAGNIFNGPDNIYAALNYAKHRYGPSLSFLGNGHGYANGGITDKPAIFGEKGPEMAIPLVPTKATRAWELIGKAIGILSNQSGFNNQQPVADQKEKKEEHEFRQAVLLLLQQLVSKDGSANITLTTPDGRKLWEVVEPFFKDEQRSNQIKQRRGLSGSF
ncbi:phage tail tape measure protein [uncultured Lactobacillus sp.]|uniref:phage tail tape measure protein n=1 Tax=uncultured Lactobacillus sp. TaxID=153152 RepID=UPI0025FA2B4C|nr:phage tail tape measure protein [uncultured Lactobacillus sp.]